MKKYNIIFFSLFLLLAIFAFSSCSDDEETDLGATVKSEPNAIGDIVLNDGTAISASDASNISKSQKEKAVAVIFYVGNSSDLLGAKKLGVGIKNTGTSTVMWAKSGTNGYENSISSILCSPSKTGSSAAVSATFTGDMDGSDNWSALKSSISDDTSTTGNYPAWEYVNNYGTKNGVSGNWYMPTLAELTMLYRAKDTVNASLSAVGGTTLNNWYWSSSQSSHYYYYVWMLNFSSGYINNHIKGYTEAVCAIRKF